VVLAFDGRCHEVSVGERGPERERSLRLSAS
jgi:hypothetical protein